MELTSMDPLPVRSRCCKSARKVKNWKFDLLYIFPGLYWIRLNFIEINLVRVAPCKSSRKVNKEMEISLIFFTRRFFRIAPGKKLTKQNLAVFGYCLTRYFLYKNCKTLNAFGKTSNIWAGSKNFWLKHQYFESILNLCLKINDPAFISNWAPPIFPVLSFRGEEL